MRTILVTGASGLLGTHLLPLLNGDRVVVLGRPAADLSRPLDPALLPDKVDAVIYLAQSTRFREFPEGADDVFAVNVAAPIRLLDYARRAGARQFVYASTGAVYRPSAQPLGEEAAVGSRGELGYYAATKLAAELLAQSYSGVLDVVLLRYFFVYGAGQKAQMLVPRLIESVRSGTPVRLQGDDGIRLNPIVASEAAQAVVAALGLAGSHTINVAGPEVVSIRGLCEEIGHRVGREPEFIAADPASDLVADISEMRRLLLAPVRRFAEEVHALVEGEA